MHAYVRVGVHVSVHASVVLVSTLLYSESCGLVGRTFVVNTVGVHEDIIQFAVSGDSTLEFDRTCHAVAASRLLWIVAAEQMGRVTARGGKRKRGGVHGDEQKKR